MQLTVHFTNTKYRFGWCIEEAPLGDDSVVAINSESRHFVLLLFCRFKHGAFQVDKEHLVSIQWPEADQQNHKVHYISRNASIMALQTLHR